VAKGKMPKEWFLARAAYVPRHFDPTVLVLHRHGVALLANGIYTLDLNRSVKYLPNFNKLGLVITGKLHDRREFGFLVFNEMVVCINPGIVRALNALGIDMAYDIDMSELLERKAELFSLEALRSFPLKKSQKAEASKLANEALNRYRELLTKCGKSLASIPPEVQLDAVLAITHETDISVNLPYIILVASGRLREDFIPDFANEELARLGMELTPPVMHKLPYGYPSLLLLRKGGRRTLMDAAYLIFDKSIFFTLSVDELADILGLTPDKVSSSLRGYRVVDADFVRELLARAKSKE